MWVCLLLIARLKWLSRRRVTWTPMNGHRRRFSSCMDILMLGRMTFRLVRKSLSAGSPAGKTSAFWFHQADDCDVG